MDQVIKSFHDFMQRGLPASGRLHRSEKRKLNQCKSPGAGDVSRIYGNLDKLRGAVTEYF
jgi:hypothetical protein